MVVALLAVWYIVANRHDWCVKETKKVTVKKRVSRKEIMSQTTSRAGQKDVHIGMYLAKRR